MLVLVKEEKEEVLRIPHPAKDIVLPIIAVVLINLITSMRESWRKLCGQFLLHIAGIQASLLI